jgi:DNA mismatch repair protein MutL
MTKINILDSSVYNRISAGEVVENPASIIKELVENSIDAGAQNISVYIEDGGIKSIQVIDDGEGMTKDDLLRSIQPHATSKIKTAEDLELISTLGFRGEALASIAAVSALDIKSKYIESDLAHGIEIKGGDLIKQGVVALNKGTSITVSSLFYNTPARYKFLKSKRSEENFVSQLMSEIILSNPDIAIRYYIDKRLVFSSSGIGLYDAIKSVYSEEIVQNIVEVEYNEPPYSVRGFIAKPSSPAIKHNRSFQTMIINGRIIKDFTLSSIVQNAYGESLMRKTFPLFVLDVVLPFDKVDVNVHPNKKEVRFSTDCKINSVVYKAVKEALLEQITKQSNEFDFLSKPPQQPTPIIHIEEKEASNTSDYPTSTNQSKLSKSVNLHKKVPKYSPVEFENLFDSIIVERKSDFDLSATPIKPVKTEGFRDNKVPFTLKHSTNYKIIGQIFDTYILIEYNDAVYIIDQHAAHERKLYDAYIKNIGLQTDSQQLLVPFVFEGDSESLLKNSALFEEMGFEIENFGGNMIRILSVPLAFSDIDIDGFFTAASEMLSMATELENMEIIKDKLAKTACKSAIKGGVSLSNEDIRHILDMFFESGIPMQCPHGRPTIIKMTRQEIEKMFRRIV